jgi:hypothetical protein
MLNSTDKKKIDKILEEKIEEYKKEIKTKNKNKIEEKAEQIRKNPPQELVDSLKILKEMKINLKALGKKTEEKFPGWDIEETTSWRSEDAEYSISLKGRNECISTGGRYAKSEYMMFYELPELKTLQEKIVESEKEVTTLGKNATLELYLGSKPPLDVMEKLDKDVKAIINKQI